VISWPRTLLAGVLAVALMGFAGCQDDEDPTPSATEPASTRPGPTTPMTSAPTETASEPTDATSSPGVRAAAGPELLLETSSVHAPEGWVKEDPIADYEASASKRDGGGLITLLDTEGLDGDDSPDAIYQATVDSLPRGAKPARQPDALLGEEQQPAVFVTYTLPGDEGSFAIVVTSRGGRSISVNFALKPSDLQENPDLVTSVIASFEWV
jgi:hypothetical protein